MTILMGNTKFESVLIPSKTKRLYVFLGGYNTNPMYPTFTRISWCEKFDGYCLYFDDPTRIEKNFSPSYYFGTKNENYLDYIYDIILRIAKLNEITNKNICIIGSSHAGFCSLYLADKIVGCNAIALCPQVDVELLNGNKFSDVMDVSYKDNLYTKRLNVLRILGNEKSSFFIFSNILCGHDRKQMSLLYEQAGKEMNLGLSQLSTSVKCLLAEINSFSPHHAQPDEYFVQIIEKIMDKPITKETEDLCNVFVGEMKRYYEQNKQLEELKKRIYQ